MSGAKRVARGRVSGMELMVILIDYGNGQYTACLSVEKPRNDANPISTGPDTYEGALSEFDNICKAFGIQPGP